MKHREWLRAIQIQHVIHVIMVLPPLHLQIIKHLVHYGLQTVVPDSKLR